MKKILITEEQLNELTESMFSFDENEIIKKINNLHNLPKEYKDFAIQHVQYITKAKNGTVTGLSLPKNFKQKLIDQNLPTGFDIGVDKNGYFIHTHRASSKRYDSIDNITNKDIKFIDSTG